MPAHPPPANSAGPVAPPLPTAVLPDGDFEAWLLAAVVLAAAGLFATVRVALHRVSASRVLGAARSDSERERLERLLRRSNSLATSAHALLLACVFVFAVLLLGTVAAPARLDAGGLALALTLALPALLFATEVLPGLFARSKGHLLLRAFLPTFYVLQWPIAVFVLALESFQAALLRLCGIQAEPEGTQGLVAELRDVIVEADPPQNLAATEREIIENVIEFGGVDVAEIMTPRTELVAVDVEDGLSSAAAAIIESGHSRIPVYAGNLDSIIGWIAARDVVRLSARDAEPTELRSVLRHLSFVPETKLVTQLFSEFRRERQKIAIVLDEYGGTAGLVTMGDVLSEIVGDFQDEFDVEEPLPLRKLAEGVFEVDAGMRVSEVNEALELDLPEEEDFETLAGFVLAVLGHFPKAGEAFQRDRCSFEVAESSDRRVLKVVVRPDHIQRAG